MIRYLGTSVGIEIADWDDVEIGDSFEVDGDHFIVVRKESLTKYTDGVYSGRPAWIQLRGFTLDKSPSG